jgi:hypothetical protein
MGCEFKKPVPGDCHVTCIRDWEVNKSTNEHMEAIRCLPSHAGLFPFVFNDGFGCRGCDMNKQEVE